MHDNVNGYNYSTPYDDPLMGRFLQTDPMGYTDSMNLYQGFGMNPVNFVDPNGEKLFIGGDKQQEMLAWLNQMVKIELDKSFNVTGENLVSQSATLVAIPSLAGTMEISLTQNNNIFKDTIPIDSNAGAWLISTLIQSPKVYLLGCGDDYPSLSSSKTPISKSDKDGDIINNDYKNDPRLDRIRNPKKNQKKNKNFADLINGKHPNELPPMGIDGLVWFDNVFINSVKNGKLFFALTNNPKADGIKMTIDDFYYVIFHELLELYLKVEEGLPYTDSESPLQINGKRQGAHSYSIHLEQVYLRKQKDHNTNISGGNFK